MFRFRYLILFLFLFPMFPDLSCVPVYAQERTIVETGENYIAAILFFLCVLVGNRLWYSFISSFEKGN